MQVAFHSFENTSQNFRFLKNHKGKFVFQVSFSKQFSVFLKDTFFKQCFLDNQKQTM